MSPSFRQAVYLNNQAVNALLDGNRTAAIQGLVMSLRIMKSAAAMLPSPPSSDSKFGTTPSFGRRSTTTATTALPTNNNLQFQRIPVPCDDEESPDNTVVFNEAIHLPTTVTSPDQLSMVEWNVYASVILYNFALSYQLVGTQSNLRKAEKLYSLVMKAIDDHEGTYEVLPPIAMIIKLGSINNLSQIKYSNGDYEGILLQCDGDDGDGSSILNLFMSASEESRLLRRLLLTALLLKPPSTASAA